MGLDYSYNLVAAEEFGIAAAGGVPLSIGVQTDMCTPPWPASAPPSRKRNSCALPSPVKSRLHRRQRSGCRLGRGGTQDQRQVRRR